MRTEFGVERSSCSCPGCVINCQHMPGYLIPADLARMAGGAEIFGWARIHLRASPGAKVMHLATGRVYRIPTLVPAHRSSGSCHFLKGGQCTVHATAPFACAFFGCTASHEGTMARLGIEMVATAMADAGSLYHQVWETLNREGLVCPTPEEKRAAIARALQSKN